MIISGFEKLTLLDFPGKVACIIFTQGCNFKCSYCQNSDLLNCSGNGLISEEEIFKYLEKRKKVLDGVVVSGGEPTIQRDLLRFIKRIKELGFLVKLDTNGSNPNVLKKLIEEKLVDYVAMDIKNVFNKYSDVIKININLDKIKESIELLKASNVNHEFRTTIIKSFHSLDDILKICEYLGKYEKIYLQNFEDSDGVIDKSLKSFTKDELIEIQNEINSKFTNVKVRGL